MFKSILNRQLHRVQPYRTDREVYLSQPQSLVKLGLERNSYITQNGSNVNNPNNYRSLLPYIYQDAKGSGGIIVKDTSKYSSDTNVGRYYVATTNKLIVDKPENGQLVLHRYPPVFDRSKINDATYRKLFTDAMISVKDEQRIPLFGQDDNNEIVLSMAMCQHTSDSPNSTTDDYVFASLEKAYADPYIDKDRDRLSENYVYAAIKGYSCDPDNFTDPIGNFVAQFKPSGLVIENKNTDIYKANSEDITFGVACQGNVMHSARQYYSKINLRNPEFNECENEYSIRFGLKMHSDSFIELDDNPGMFYIYYLIYLSSNFTVIRNWVKTTGNHHTVLDYCKKTEHYKEHRIRMEGNHVNNGKPPLFAAVHLIAQGDSEYEDFIETKNNTVVFKHPIITIGNEWIVV